MSYLLIQATQEYLEKQKALIANSTTNIDAQNLIKALDLKQDNNLLLIRDNMTKSQIEIELNQKINLLKDKELTLERN